MNATISRDQLNELTEVVEDAIQYTCDQERMSGEKAWAIVQCLAETKLAELNVDI